MTPEQAVTLVNSMRFRPGWTLHAELYPPFYGEASQILVSAEVETYDTRFRTADGELIAAMQGRPAAVIEVTADMEEPDLAHALIVKLVRPFDDHEDREFLVSARDGAWYATLHPHTDEGRASWARHLGDRLERALDEYELIAAGQL